MRSAGGVDAAFTLAARAVTAPCHPPSLSSTALWLHSDCGRSGRRLRNRGSRSHGAVPPTQPLIHSLLLTWLSFTAGISLPFPPIHSPLLTQPLIYS